MSQWYREFYRIEVADRLLVNETKNMYIEAKKEQFKSKH